VEDLAIVDHRDNSIGDSIDHLIEVCLGSEGIEGGLQQEWWVLRSDGSLDWVEWDWEWW
jgi:hypothetical protein